MYLEIEKTCRTLYNLNERDIKIIIKHFISEDMNEDDFDGNYQLLSVIKLLKEEKRRKIA